MPHYLVLVDTTPGAAAGPLWRALGAAEQPVTVHQLHLASNAHPLAIRERVWRWARAGLVQRQRRPGRGDLYLMHETTERTPEPPRVTHDGRVLPRTRTARERLWSAMRTLKTFDLPALQITAEVTRRSAEDYINCLQRSGHLRLLARGNSMTGEWSRYLLARNSGRRCPQISHRSGEGGRVREVVDPNTGERVDISAGRVNLRRRAAAAAPAVVDGGVS